MRRAGPVPPTGRGRIEALQTPLRDDALMVGPPSCTAADFALPRLRRCPSDLDGFVWGPRLGAGLDGCVWKVWSGDQGPFILKVFWDTEPPELAHYYAPQRECQIAALLQMMETAVEKAAAASRPILLYADPKTWEDALDNQAAFSNEARLAQQLPAGQELEPGYRHITTMPRMRKCYGWLTVESRVFRELPFRLKLPVIKVDKLTRFIERDKEYTAILYEYVDEAENDVDVVQEAMDFFWLAGFSRTLSQLPQNWKSGVLIDLCDISPPCGYGWSEARYRRGPYSAALMLQQPEAGETPYLRAPSHLARSRAQQPVIQATPTQSSSSSPSLPPSPSPSPTQPSAQSSPQAPHSYNLRPRNSHPGQATGNG